MSGTRIEKVKANMRRINELLDNYEAMEEALCHTTIDIIYVAAAKQMRRDYKMIMEEMNKMLNDIDNLGTYSESLKKLEYHRIEKHQLFEP